MVSYLCRFVIVVLKHRVEVLLHVACWPRSRILSCPDCKAALASTRRLVLKHYIFFLLLYVVFHGGTDSENLLVVVGVDGGIVFISCCLYGGVK